MADVTYAQLGSLGSINGGDLVAVWPVAGPGPLQTVTAGQFKSYVTADLGTAALADTGTSGHTLVYADGANTWSAAQTFGDITVTGNAQYTGSTGGPGEILLNKGTFSSSQATLDVALDAAYNIYRLELLNCDPVTDGAILGARVSVDNGSTYLSGAADYSYTGAYSEVASLAGYGDDDNDRIVLTPAGLTNTVGFDQCVSIVIRSPGSMNTVVSWHDGYMVVTSTLAKRWFSGSARLASNVKATNLRLLFSSGSLARGTWVLYGGRGV